MVSINTPEIYINEPGAIHKVADYTELAIGEGRKPTSSGQRHRGLL